MLGAPENENFADTPWRGASYGELLATPEPEPPSEQPVGLQIERPPWAAELERGDYDLAKLAPPTKGDGLSALQRMQLDDDGFDPEPPPDPPLKLEPLLPVKLPEVDWREEEKRRETGEVAYHDLSEGEEQP